jgi:hypothetical protein
MNKLEKGLREMNISIDDLMQNYTYVGGNCGDGLKRWKRIYGDEKTPETYIEHNEDETYDYGDDAQYL